MLKRTKLFGFSFISESDIDIVVNDILYSGSYTINNALPFLITPNVDIIVQFSKNENQNLKKLFANSLYILPDGQPIVWCSKLLRNELKNRLSGSDLFPVLWNKSKDFSCKILVLTSSDQISQLLLMEHKNVICYTLPFFNSTDQQEIVRISRDCLDIITNHNIKIVLIGISFPKQGLLAVNIYNLLLERGFKNIPLFCMLGAAFEFYLNLKRRAPVFIRNIGFEWLYRFSKEPKRLFRRYFIEDPAFVLIFLKELFLKDK